MARKQNRILPMEGATAPGKAKARVWLWPMVALGVLLMIAYVDGGEEPLRPISQHVAVSEGD